MKEVSKLSTILKAFTTKADVDEQVHKHRIDVCNGCDRNSSNVEDKDLSFVNKARKKLGKDFCLECGCNIQEKTSQAVEQCPLGYWNRLVLETSDAKDLDLLNLDSSKVSLHLEDNFFVADVGKISEDFNFKLGLTCTTLDFSVLRIIAGCGSCTRALLQHKEVPMADITLLYDKLPNKKPFLKTVTIKYQVSKEERSVVLKLRGETI